MNISRVWRTCLTEVEPSRTRLNHNWKFLGWKDGMKRYSFQYWHSRYSPHDTKTHTRKKVLKSRIRVAALFCVYLDLTWLNIECFKRRLLRPTAMYQQPSGSIFGMDHLCIGAWYDWWRQNKIYYRCSFDHYLVNSEIIFDWKSWKIYRLCNSNNWAGSLSV